jgi:hypothetical protein
VNAIAMSPSDAAQPEPVAVDSPLIVVTAVGAAEGSRGAAAALACAGADPDRATLLIDIGARPPRPTLLTSTAAQRLEERLVAHLPTARVAARGQVCHLTVAPEDDGYATASAAATVARGAAVVVHAAPGELRRILDGQVGLRPNGALLRADLAVDRALVALAVRDLLDHELAVSVLKRRLNWVAERRAHFGALPPGQAGGLPPHALSLLQTKDRCCERDEPGPVQV